MSKTNLNMKIDKFFKKINGQKITEELIINHLDLNETNEYGNILHAFVNYSYPEKQVLEIIKICLDLGVDPNYQSEITGYTFIHLALYGYTDEENQDKSFSEEFLIMLIQLALSHGFNVNLLDHDGESPVMSAIASEVYTGSILNILKALGPNVSLDKHFLEVYKEYLEESKNNEVWHNRLVNEQQDVFRYVQEFKLNLNISDLVIIDKKIANHLKALLIQMEDMDYQKLKSVYPVIQKHLEEINILLDQRNLLNSDNQEIMATIIKIKDSIANLIENEIIAMHKNPTVSQIETAFLLVNSFMLEDLIERLEEIKMKHQKMMRTKTNTFPTLREGKALIEEIKSSEMYDELKPIVEERIAIFLKAISNLNMTRKRKEEIEMAIVPLFSVEKQEEVSFDMENLSLGQIEKLTNDSKHIISSYKNVTVSYLNDTFSLLLESLQQIIEVGVISREEIKDVFDSIVLGNNKRKRKR